MDWIKGKYYELKADEDIPQSKELKPSSELILKIVCGYYDIAEAALFKTRRGRYNEPRNALIYLLRKFRQERLREIGRQFKIERYSSVSSIIERVKIQMRTDRVLRKKIDELSQKINKSQEQT